ncbi:Arc family DNA binding domain-containing protein [Niabella beijingensis]|uniref:Arc family DNA binding domain-containing protein n=1 Tax=Niabella beijingensis TaxID=2872700 RepID=UPI001CBF125C|nr:Arc family DNA binding domain-containing protein [Niabella beijingensis]MBZ4191234.1 Arc family DNA binding domain-containing protein [Niabella beijingensis]
MKEKKSFILRMDQAVYSLMEKWAADEFRSVNGQIEYLLQKALIESGRKKTKMDEQPSGKNKGRNG